MKRPYPSTEADFLREYSSHSKEELIRAVASLSAKAILDREEINKLRKLLAEAEQRP